MTSDVAVLNPLTAPAAKINEALLLGALVGNPQELAAVRILAAVDGGRLTNIEWVRRAVYLHPATQVWRLDWYAFAARRFEIRMSNNDHRTMIEFACALGADTPLRFLGTKIASLPLHLRAELCMALTIACESEER